MRSRMYRLFAFVSLIALFAIVVPVFGQVDTGGVRGTVTDQSGAVLTNATVTLKNTATGLVSTTTTSGDGTYNFNPVKIGPYDVSVKSAGFRGATSHVTVRVQDQIRADFTMVTGGATEHVEVTEVAPQLQTHDASVGAVVDAAQINDLPLNGRNYTFLAQTIAGVTGIKAQRNMDASGSFVANGLPTVHNNYLLDGIDNNNDTVDFLNGAAYASLPPPDALQEFKVQTSNFSAEFGRAGGAVVNASIKSGTNQFHGSAWEFLRNEMLDATNVDQYFVPVSNKMKAPNKQNQFGGAIGGPIRKNKTFFFGDYEGTRFRKGSIGTQSVPTASEVASGYTDFRDMITSNPGQMQTDILGRTMNPNTILDPGTTRYLSKGSMDPVSGLLVQRTGYVRDPFYTGGSIAGITDFRSSVQYLNQLPTSRISANGVNLMRVYPAANRPPTAGVRGNYTSILDRRDDTDHFDTRVDHVLSDHDMIFGRASVSRETGYYPGLFPEGSPTDSYGFPSGDVLNNSVNTALSETHVFSSKLINEFRAGFSFLYTSIEPPESTVMGVPAKYGIQGIPQIPHNGGLPFMTISGLSQLGAAGWENPNWRRSKTLQLTDNVTRIAGSHSFKTGVEFQNIAFPYYNPPYSRGYFTFNGSYTGIPTTLGGGSIAYVGIADLLLTPIASTVGLSDCQSDNNAPPCSVSYVGGPNSVQASAINQPRDTRKYVGAYFQDDWKVNRKLTLNLGLRWEYFSEIGAANGMQAALISNDNGMTAEYDILSSQKNVAMASSFFSVLAKDNIPIRYVDNLLTIPKNNFAPRVGLAYQLSSRLVARLGYGIFFGGFENIGGSPDPAANYPFAASFNFTPNVAGITPITYADGTTARYETGLSAANPDPASSQFKANGLSPQAYNRDWKTAYTQQWNASVQYQFTHSDSITAAYVGNNSIHSVNAALINTPTILLPTGTNVTQYVRFPDLSKNMNYLVPNGRAYYRSFQLTYERQFRNGLSARANYTRSLCMTDSHNALGFGDDAIASAYQLTGWDNLTHFYTYCGMDTPNLLHASGIWRLPIGKGRLLAKNASGVLNAFIGGWSAQSIYTIENGFPGYIGCTVIPTAGLRACYAQVVPGKSVYADSGENRMWNHRFLNPAAFTNPPAVTSIGQTDFSPVGGTSYQYHGPNFQQLDFSIFKRFKTTETTNLELRGESFNLLNHPNFGNTFRSGNFNDPKNFGIISGTRGIGREVQVAMKFYF